MTEVAATAVEEVCGGFARRSGEKAGDKNLGGSNSVVESQPSKLLVAGSIPVSRSIFIGGDPGTPPGGCRGAHALTFAPLGRGFARRATLADGLGRVSRLGVEEFVRRSE